MTAPVAVPDGAAPPPDAFPRPVGLQPAIGQVTAMPGLATDSLADRLATLADSLVASHTDRRQWIDLKIDNSARLGTARRDATILRIVRELVANALVHGLHMRLLGAVTIRIADRPEGGVLIDVANNGWRLARPVAFGGGLKRVAALAGEQGGSLLSDDQPQTRFRVVLPAERGPT